jgi:hypothetical protein
MTDPYTFALSERYWGQTDLFGLPLPFAGIEHRRLADPLDQSRQTEDLGTQLCGCAG